MLKTVYKYWKTKFFIINDDWLCKVAIIASFIIIMLGIGVIEIISAIEMNIFGVLIILAASMQYKQKYIINNIVSSQGDVYRVNTGRCYAKYCIMQSFKDNFMLIPTVCISLLESFVLLFVNPKAAVLILILLSINIAMYYIAIKMSFEKRFNKTTEIKPIYIINMGGVYNNLSYIMRMSIGDYLWMLLEMAILVILVQKGINISYVNYTLTLLLVLEIEATQDKEMNNFEHEYGRYAIKELSVMNWTNKFVVSREFKIFLKYMIISGVLLYKKDICTLIYVFMFLAITYRYYSGDIRIIKLRCKSKIAIFRCVLVYMILFSMSPFMFFDEIQKIYTSYSTNVASIISIIIIILLFIVPVERIVKIQGEPIDEMVN